MMQITFLYCLIIFSLHFCFQRVVFQKLAQIISIFLLFNILLGMLVWLCSCLIILGGDVEVNPGPKNNVSECLSICHWNLNSIFAHDYSKLFLLKAYFWFTNLILFVSQKHMIHLFPLMMTIW